MELKNGFINTNIGIFPNDWDVMDIPNLIIRKDGIKIGPFGSQLKKELLVNSGFKVYGQENVFEKNMTIGNRFITQEHYKELKSCELQPGDFIISMMGTIGKCMIVPGNFEKGIMDSHLLRLRPQSEIIDIMFLLFFFSSKILLNQVSKLCVGGIMDGLSSSIIKKLLVPLPPTKEEQTAIATALSDVDNLIHSLENLIAKKRNIKLVVMQQLLLPKKHWSTKQIKEIVITPVTDGPHETPLFFDRGIPFLSVNNLVNNKIDLSDLRYISEEDHLQYSKKCKPQRGDILLGKAASVGKTAIVELDIEFNIWSPIALIRPKIDYNSIFIYYLIQSTEVIKQINFFTNSSSQGNLGMGDIEKLELYFPPKDEQFHIATVLNDMDTEIEALEQRLNKYRMIKQGMMQKLLTGQIRLV